jgi:hypothetical protein
VLEQPSEGEEAGGGDFFRRNECGSYFVTFQLALAWTNQRPTL